jgi:hypothetical protein
VVGEAVRQGGEQWGQEDVERVGDGEVVRQLQPGWTVAGVRNRLRDAGGGFFGAHGTVQVGAARGEEGASSGVVVGGGAALCGTLVYIRVRPWCTSPVSVRGRRRRRGGDGDVSSRSGVWRG